MDAFLYDMYDDGYVYMYIFYIPDNCHRHPLQHLLNWKKNENWIIQFLAS